MFRLLGPDGEYLGFTNPPGGGVASRGHWVTSSVDEASGEPVPTVYRMVPAVDGFEYR